MEFKKHFELEFTLIIFWLRDIHGRQDIYSSWQYSNRVINIILLVQCLHFAQQFKGSFNRYLPVLLALHCEECRSTVQPRHRVYGEAVTLIVIGQDQVKVLSGGYFESPPHRGWIRKGENTVSKLYNSYHRGKVSFFTHQLLCSLARDALSACE